MSKTVNLTKEELQQIQELGKQYNNVALALGEAELRKEALRASYKELVAVEKEVYKQLGEKYGNGSIDLSTGIITLSDSVESENE